MEFDFPKIEEKVLEFWEKKNIFKKLREKNKGNPRFSFLDGPITANNPMGVHHAWGRTYKDLFQRFKAMQGFDQRFQNGFDCQGLWVEVEVEKELGFKTKKDIEKFGIEKFVKACKERVLKFAKLQTAQSMRLGQWMDWENSYYTMSDENNYAIWHFLKKCWEKGWLYKGKDVVPWCPRCGTAISQHEILTEEYQEVVHRSVFFKLPVVGKENTFFLVWTTTPWTLPGNTAVALHPEFSYAWVKDKKGDIFILLEKKSSLIPEGKIIKKQKGIELGDLKYQGMFNELPVVKEVIKEKQYSVVFWDQVSEEEGTGIVHIAPGCGQEDFQLSKEYALSVIDPTDDESRYERGFGFVEGKLVSEATDLIFENLKKKNLIFRIEDYKHRYPVCWRCKTELIFRLVDEWYIAMDSLRAHLIEVTRKIHWIPSFGLEREIDWLQNMKDWLISKKRYWGLALPIFECKKCRNFEVLGSKEELKERAVSGWQEFEGHSPHRPWIDKMKIQCSKCKELVSRVPDVGNPWLDAGIVPFSTMGYFTDKNYWKLWFPPDFICESFPGQFKNWFYAILVMSTVLEDSPPVKTIFGYALVKDEKGEEMHKSKGNVIWFDEAVKKIGADVMRWMYVTQNPIFNLKFGWKTLDEKKRKLLTLWNSCLFFQTYTKESEFPDIGRVPRSGNVLDQWILSRLQNLIEGVNRNLERYNTQIACLKMEKFFIEDLSLWYIRRSRKRFQDPQTKEEKKEAAETLYYILLNLTKLLAPILPFFSEHIYTFLQKSSMPESIHLMDWPKVDRAQVKKDLEEKMDLVRKTVTIALAERRKHNIRVRQPLHIMRIKNRELQKTKEMVELIKEEVNVKEILFDKNLKEEILLDTKITPQLKEEGIVREVIRHIQKMRKEAGLTPKEEISITFSAPPYWSQIFEGNKNFILQKTKARGLKPKEKSNKVFEKKIEIKVYKEKLWIAIKKL